MEYYNSRRFHEQTIQQRERRQDVGFTSNGGWAVCRHSGRYCPALAITEISGSDTVSITISLERLVDSTQTVAGLVGQQLHEAVGQEKMSSDGEPGDGSGNRGAAASATLPVSSVEDEQGPHISASECRTSDDWLKKGRTDGFRCSDDPENICVCIRK